MYDRHRPGIALSLFSGFALLASGAFAQGFSGFTKLATEANILSVQGVKGDYDSNTLSVGATGVIYVVDPDAGAPTGQSIIRIVPGVPTVGLMANQADMVAAIEAVNGTTAVTSFSPRGIGVAQNGNIIVAGFTNVANAETLLSLTDATPATITVLHTSVNGSTSDLDGMEALTVLGNAAYIGTNENNGNATLADAIVAFDVTAAGPSVPGTIITNKAALEAAFGVAGESWANHLTNNGTDLFAIISGSAAAPDVVGRITTAGVASVHLTKSAVLNALIALDAGTTDVGYSSLTVDANGTIYLSNSAGNAASLYDDSIVSVGNISGGTGIVRGIAKATLATALGITAGSFPLIGIDSLAHDAINSRILFADGREAPATNEGIWAFTPQDYVAPTVTSVDVVTEDSVDVTFNEPMGGAGVLAGTSYTISGSGQGTLSANPDSVVLQVGNTYRLNWSSGSQSFGGDVTITVGSAATDAIGNAIGSPNSGTDLGGGLPVELSGFSLE